MIIACKSFMKKILFIISLIFLSFTMSGCFNKHGISAKYYSDCDEYYDMQGYYHKECGKDDIVTYKDIKKSIKKIDQAFREEKVKKTKNVW